MKTSHHHLTLTTFAHEFTDAPGPKFNGWILTPAHPPCLCIKPSEIPIYEKIFDDLREEEKLYAGSGKTLWFVIYKQERGLLYGFLLSPSSKTQPTTVELSRHCNWLSCMELIASESTGGRLHKWSTNFVSGHASGSK